MTMKTHFARIIALGAFALVIGSALVGCEPAQKAAAPGAGIDSMPADMKADYKNKMMNPTGKAPTGDGK